MHVHVHYKMGRRLSLYIVLVLTNIDVIKSQPTITQQAVAELDDECDTSDKELSSVSSSAEIETLKQAIEVVRYGM